MLYRIGWSAYYLLFHFFYRAEVQGKNIIPRNRPFILAANHASNFDPPLLGVTCPVKVRYLAKEELFRNPLFAFCLKAVGAIPLARTKTDIKSVRLSLEILKKEPLLIFPQGTRSSDFDKVYSGVGFICKKAKVPVIAAKVSGTEKVFPKGAKFPRLGRIKVTFKKVDNIAADDTYEDITQKVIAAIKSL